MSARDKRPRWRTKADARTLRLGAQALAALPLGTVRRFRAGGLSIVAEHHAPGRWRLYTGAVDSQALAGLLSVECERRPGADGGWQ